MGRSPCCDKSNVKRGPWSPEEDAVLKSYVDKHGHGGNWISLPQKAGLKRCGKSCRLRWLNYLRPDIKHGGFTDEEDNIIVSLYNKLGSRWSVIASHLSGRTDNDVKNYWNTKLKKKLTAMKQQKQLLATGQAANQFDPKSTIPAPSLPQPQIPVIKAEVYSHIEEFSKPLQPNFVLSNFPHKYNSEAQPYLENRQLESLPVLDEISTVENRNSLVNWIGSDDVFFSDFSEIISGYGDSVPSCYNRSVAFS